MKDPNLKKLVPAEGRTVPLPDGSPWPTKKIKVRGKDVAVPVEKEVAMSRYFRRRLKDGDLVDVEAADQAGADAQTDGAQDQEESPAPSTGKGKPKSNSSKGK